MRIKRFIYKWSGLEFVVNAINRTVPVVKTLSKGSISLMAVFSLVGWSYLSGVHTSIARADIQPSIVRVTKPQEFPPFLKRICFAESGGRQFNKNGSVIRGIVDKSDIGVCQINERYNNDLARKLGYDIYTEEGNKAFALYLFNNRGTQPWNASKCTERGWGTKSECNN